MVLTCDQEFWGIALWVEKYHGKSGLTYIASQIERLALGGDGAGVTMWRTVAARFDQLRQAPEADSVS
jgi:hypothetical protein